MNEEEFDPKDIIAYMKVGYREFGDIEMLEPMIDQLVSLLITIHVRTDKEFKLALGDGYYK